jgi:uncharacterized protein with HEPN domain
MTEREQKLLLDIYFAIQYVEEYKMDVPSFEMYIQNDKTRFAIERQLAIIGEAAVKLKQPDTALEISHLKEITGFRNILIHAYDHVNNETVWEIIQQFIPVLHKEIKTAFVLDGFNPDEF